jgi:hypothetical protein
MTSTKVKFDGNLDVVDTETTPTTGQYLKWDGSKWINASAPADDRVAVFTVEGELAVGEISSRFYYPFTSGSLQATRIRAAVNTAPTGASLTVELRLYNSSGSVACGTATVSASAYTGSNASLSNDYITPGHWWQIAITQVGSTVAGSDLVFQVMCQPSGL